MPLERGVAYAFPTSIRKHQYHISTVDYSYISDSTRHKEIAAL